MGRGHRLGRARPDHRRGRARAPGCRLRPGGGEERARGCGRIADRSTVRSSGGASREARSERRVGGGSGSGEGALVVVDLYSRRLSRRGSGLARGARGGVGTGDGRAARRRGDSRVGRSRVLRFHAADPRAHSRARSAGPRRAGAAGDLRAAGAGRAASAGPARDRRDGHRHHRSAAAGGRGRGRRQRAGDAQLGPAD